MKILVRPERIMNGGDAALQKWRNIVKARSLFHIGSQPSVTLSHASGTSSMCYRGSFQISGSGRYTSPRPPALASTSSARNAGYVPTYFWPDTALGAFKNSFRCENLEVLTFADASFDLVITQDVMEHVMNPRQAFSEIARTLKPGGAHVFTVPWYAPNPTFIRAAKVGESIEYFAEKNYHGSPIDEGGALVVTEWGTNLPEFIFKHGGLVTTVFMTRDRRMGLAGEFIEVFVSRKPT